MVQQYFDSELTGKVIGLAIKVHKELGSAYEEKIYQRALYLELQKSGLKIEREKEIIVYYNNICVGKKKLDFLVEGRLIIEIKKSDTTEEVFVSQVVSYLKTVKVPLGLILNFGNKRLEIKRVKL